MTEKFPLLAVGAIAGLLAASVSLPAHAVTPTSDAISALIQTTTNASSEEEAVLDNVAEIATANAADQGVEVNVEGVDIVLPRTSNEPVELADGTSSLRIGLPFANAAVMAIELETGVVAYDNRNGSTTVPVVKEDGTIQITSIIETPQAPTRYEYDLNLKAGETLALGENGAAAVVDRDGRFVGGFAPPWATDASGTAVPTHFEINGDVLVQVVNHSSDHAYPVVADPYAGLPMVDGVRWTKRDPRGWTLVVTPSIWARGFGGAYLAGEGGWPEVVDRESRVSSGPRSWNRTQMKWQYICHQQFAFFKETWNLDTWVVRSSYLDSVANGCN